jgi:hypothetical protein
MSITSSPGSGDAAVTSVAIRSPSTPMSARSNRSPAASSTMPPVNQRIGRLSSLNPSTRRSEIGARRLEVARDKRVQLAGGDERRLGRYRPVFPQLANPSRTAPTAPGALCARLLTTWPNPGPASELSATPTQLWSLGRACAPAVAGTRTAAAAAAAKMIRRMLSPYPRCSPTST